MSFDHPNCFRGHSDREPLSNTASDTHEEDGVGQTYTCVGYLPKNRRGVHQDRFCYCCKSNDGVDIAIGADRRDLLSTVRVISNALMYDENIRVYENDATDQEMNDMDLVAIMRGEL